MSVDFGFTDLEIENAKIFLFEAMQYAANKFVSDHRYQIKQADAADFNIMFESAAEFLRDLPNLFDRRYFTVINPARTARVKPVLQNNGLRRNVITTCLQNARATSIFIKPNRFKSRFDGECTCTKYEIKITTSLIFVPNINRSRENRFETRCDGEYAYKKYEIEITTSVIFVPNVSSCRVCSGFLIIFFYTLPVRCYRTSRYLFGLLDVVSVPSILLAHGTQTGHEGHPSVGHECRLPDEKVKTKSSIPVGSKLLKGQRQKDDVHSGQKSKRQKSEGGSPLCASPMELRCVLDGTARTNNASEGWHNRFQSVVGRRHPSLYAFLTELQHEQGDTETILHQIDLGQTVREMPKGKLQEVEDRISNIVRRYDEYVEEDNVLKYLKDLGHYMHL
ncbi:unnamed protein product [Trichogramma brassicae]|uniref:Uncharacterized protein n=1 Tax=Trichogramma brassicae TaxID=86971 RepID=A0A6H5IJA6_9HYME|nr:unnamed protein product [Trichogramma brassicae]